MKQELNLKIPTEQLSILIQNQVEAALKTVPLEKPTITTIKSTLTLSSSTPSPSSSLSVSTTNITPVVATSSSSSTGIPPTNNSIESKDLNSIQSPPPSSSSSSERINSVEAVEVEILTTIQLSPPSSLHSSEEFENNSINNNNQQYLQQQQTQPNFNIDINSNSNNNNNNNDNNNNIPQLTKDAHSSSQDSSESLSPRVDSTFSETNISGNSTLGVNDESNIKSDENLESSELLSLPKDSNNNNNNNNNHVKFDDFIIPKPDSDASPEQLEDFAELVREIEKIDKESRASKRVFVQRIQKHKSTQVLKFSFVWQ